MGVREKIVSCAKAYLGVPYKSIYQGTGPEDGGFTCSGLVWRAYHDAGLEIPVAQGINSYYTGYYNGWDTQAGWVLSNGHAVYDETRLKLGDIVLYSPVGEPERTGHVAIYAGDGRVVHANGAPVSVDRLAAGGWFVVGGWPLKKLPDDSKEWFEVEKTLTFAKKANVRTKPTTQSGKVVDAYEAGESVTIDGVALADGRCWGHYIGASSKADRWVCLGTCNNLKGLA